LISLNDSISKDSIVISVGVQGQEDTLIYNDGIYIYVILKNLKFK